MPLSLHYQFIKESIDFLMNQQSSLPVSIKFENA